MSFRRTVVWSISIVLVVTAAAFGAEAVDGPVKPTWSCSNPSPPHAFSLSEFASVDQLTGARAAYVDYLKQETEHQACLLGAIARLHREWNASHEQPIVIVDAAVANAVAGHQLIKERWASSLNSSIAWYKAFAAGRGLEPVLPLDVPPVPSADESLAKPGRLMMQSYEIGGFQGCAYPRSALRSGISGNTTIGFDMDVAGVMSNIHVVKSSSVGETGSDGGDTLDAAALECVKNSRNYPEIRDGAPVASPGHERTLVFRVN